MSKAKVPAASPSIAKAARNAAIKTGLPRAALERDIRRVVQLSDISYARKAKEKALERDDMNAYRAWLVKEARFRAGLSQRELAGLLGTQQPAIARLENEKYEGDAWGMVMDIARALKMKFVPPMIAIS